MIRARDSRRQWVVGHSVSWLFGAILLVLGVGCASYGDDERNASSSESLVVPEQLTVSVVSGHSVQQTALGAAQSLLIRDRARVLRESGGFAPSSNASTPTTDLGVDSRTGDISSIAPIVLRDRARITGNAVSRGSITLNNGAVVTGQRQPNANVTVQQISWTVPFEQSTVDFVLPPDGSGALPPGGRRDVIAYSRSTLRIATGKHYLNTLDLEPQSRLVLDTRNGPIFIYIKTRFINRGTLTFNGPNDRLFIGFLGTEVPGIDTALQATVVAPNVSVRLGVGGTRHVGAFFARGIELDPDAWFTFRPFAGWGEIIDGGPDGGGPDGGPTPPDPTPRPDPLVTTAGNCGPREGLAQAAWPMQGFCPAHLGLSPFLGTRSNVLAWSFGGTGQISAQPIVDARGLIHYGTVSGTLVTLSPSGARERSLSLGSAVRDAALALRTGNVVVPDGSGRLHSVRPTGQLAWTRSVGTGRVFAPSVGNNEVIYAVTQPGLVSAVRPNGTLAWQYNLGGPATGAPLLLENATLYAASTTQVHRVNADTGVREWAVTVTGGVATAVAGPGNSTVGNLYVVTPGGTLRALNRATGAQAWQLATGVTPSAPLALRPDGLVLVPGSTGQVVAIDPVSRSVRWRGSAGSGAVSHMAAGADGMVYAGTSTGNVVALDPGNGTTFWTFAAGSAVGGVALRADGILLAGNNDGRLFAIGSSPLIGPYPDPGPRPDGGTDSGLPWDPAIGRTVGQDGGGSGPDGGGLPPWSRVARTDGGFEDAGTGMGDSGGQEGCVVPPPPGVTSVGLGGLGYLNHNNAQGTGELVFNPPTGTPPQCELAFCETDADGNEHQVDLAFSRIAQNPNTLPGPATSCPSTGGVAHCPLDPARETTRNCTVDSDCNTGAGEVCGVFCDDAACAAPRTHCGFRLAECTSLPTEPTGPFNQNNPSTWPCEELRECGETGEIVGFTGDPDPQKTGSLREQPAPNDGTTGVPLQRVPGLFAPFTETLNQTECEVASLGDNELGQVEPRSGSSGNSKWGIFVEPDIDHDANVEAKSFFGDDDFNVSAGASFRTGAKVWGHDIDIVSAEIGGSLSLCNAEFNKSFKILGREQMSLADGVNTQPPEPAETDACTAALEEITSRMKELRKALHDARLAWDSYRLNGNQASQALCDRTRLIFGDVEAGCSVLSARRWIQQYEQLANDLKNYYAGAYQDLMVGVRSKLRGNVPVSLPYATPFDGMGASFSYPVGPVVLTLEVELAGMLGATGNLVYGMDPPSAGSPSGPNAHVEFIPNAEAHAYVFAGVGLPGVSVGILGDLLLLGVSTPLSTGIALKRTTFNETREFSSSGLFSPVGGRPGLLGGGSVRQWTMDWEFRSGIILETLSGQLDLAARVRLLFFKKTFRKKIAKWKGFERIYQFVGKIDSPMKGSRTFDSVRADVPYPEPDGVEAAFNATPVGPAGDVNLLGPTTTPGLCGNPAPCRPRNEGCSTGADCCAGVCNAGVCGCKDRGTACVSDAECCTGDCRGGVCFEEVR